MYVSKPIERDDRQAEWLAIGGGGTHTKKARILASVYDHCTAILIGNQPGQPSLTARSLGLSSPPFTFESIGMLKANSPRSRSWPGTAPRRPPEWQGDSRAQRADTDGSVKHSWTRACRSRQVLDMYGLYDHTAIEAGREAHLGSPQLQSLPSKWRLF